MDSNQYDAFFNSDEFKERLNIMIKKKVKEEIDLISKKTLEKNVDHMSHIKTFLDENIEITNNEKDRIRYRTLYDIYKSKNTVEGVCTKMLSFKPFNNIMKTIPIHSIKTDKGRMHWVGIKYINN